MNKVGCRALILSPGFKGNDYFASLRALAPELDGAAPGRARRRPGCRTGDRHPPGDRDDRRACSTSPTSPRPASPAQLAALAALGASAAVRRSDQHPVHQRHHRRAEGRDADPPQHPQQRLFHRRGDAARRRPTGCAFRCRYYHCFGMVLGNLACVTHGACMVSPAEGFDPLAALEAVEAERCTGLHGVPTMFIAMLDHPRIRALRPDEPAHRHHGRLALPGRGDANGSRQHAHGRSDDRLRHDRDQPGQLPERLRRSAGAPRLDGRAHPAAYRGQDRRRRRPHHAAGRRRRIADPRLQRDARLLGRPGRDGQGDRRSALHAHRRSRDHRRRGLLQHRRPAEGHGDPRRREHLSARGRGIPLHPPRRSPTCRRSACPTTLRRAALRLDQAARRRER